MTTPGVLVDRWSAVRSPRWQVLVCALLVFGAVVVVHGPVVGHGFVLWDDEAFLFGNPDLRPPTLHGTMLRMATAQEELFMPLTQAAWALVASAAWRPEAMGGMGVLAPWPFHLASLLVHGGAAVLALLLLLRLTNRLWPALAGALLFALHPLQVEAVAWASALKDLLCGALSIGALLLYVKHVELRTPAAERRGRLSPAAACYVWATVLFVLAMLAKPSAAAVPLMALILDRWLLGRPWKSVLVAIIPWAALTVPIVLVGVWAQPTGSRFQAPLYLRPIVALDSLAFYAGKLVAPVNLGADYGRSPRWLLASDQAYFTWMIPAALAAIAYALRRRALWLGVAMALSAAALLPVLGLATFAFQSYSTVADHYVYVAMLGPALALAWALGRMRSRNAAVAVWTLVGVLLIALAVQSRQQLRTWRDSDALFTHARRVNPTSHLAAEGLVGDFLEREQWGQAAAMLRWTADGQLDQMRQLRAETLIATGQYDVARGILLTLLDRPRSPLPPDPLVREYLVALDRLQFSTTRPAPLSRRPWVSRYLAGQAQSFLMMGDRARAIGRLRAAVREDPANAAARDALQRATQLGA